jgi:hypothetical protein
MKRLLFLFSFFAFLFLCFPKNIKAQGTFDCSWTVIAGRGACRAVNINCDSGYEADYKLCGNLTPSGQSACDLSGQACVTLGTGTISNVGTPLNNGGCTGDRLDTAIGCIPLDETGIASFILRWAMGIGGGMAFALIVYSGFMMMTSQGDPKRLEAGRELMTSAIMGIALLIFAVLVLYVIGVDILQIPSFNQ